MTRRQLAERARMSQQGLSKIERGGNITLGTMVLLAQALGCQVSDFFPKQAPWNR
jgi:transcriptional regulator with XRE-family HTH domain